ncbi:MAG: hypothetical protein D6766_12810 [Verrucomicrobia bacterium]|nr:MAG: hypothetical protein D6766_12810 [Verrucomicrobiota bacterium]
MNHLSMADACPNNGSLVGSTGRRRVWLRIGRLAVLAGVNLGLRAMDPPHAPDGPVGCTDCHQVHYVGGVAFTIQQGSDNTCLSCHQPGGVAAAHAFTMSDQASPEEGVGSSHRWDSSPSGRVVSVNGSDASLLTPQGTYTGRHAKVYTLTVDAGGSTFSWVGSAPENGSGSGVTIPNDGTPVALDQGISVSFAPDTTYVAGTQWEIRVRPDLASPTDSGLLARMPDGQVVCVTCHSPHSQAHTPFDPDAPGTPGQDGRHLLRMDDDTNQLCQECHGARVVTDATQGSHPVGVDVPTVAGELSSPATLPLDPTEGKVRCLTCHVVHHAPADDGRLLRVADVVSLCTDCHENVAGDPAHNGGESGGTTTSCTDCHQAHGAPDPNNPGQDFPHLLADEPNNLCNTCHATTMAGDPAHNTNCSDCHHPHGVENPATPGVDFPHLLAQDEAGICLDCHNTTSTPVDIRVDDATPALHLDAAQAALWPGGQYGSDAPQDTDPAHKGACITCHRPHGYEDPAHPGTDYAHLLVEDMSNGQLCLTCHDSDGPATADIQAEFNRTYTHAVSDCAACHNPHWLTTAEPLRGVERISVTNTGVGQVSYTYHDASDTTGARQYEVCFACHSAGAPLAGNTMAGTVDLSLRFNTQNPGYHPVEATGKNSGINANAFVNGWSSGSTMECTDCHGSATGGVEGPHGSANAHILKAPYSTSVAKLNSRMPTDWICFNCHDYDVYANDQVTDTVANRSRFGKDGHKKHVGKEHYPCYACHDTHGSATEPHLIVERQAGAPRGTKTPGIVDYTHTANGGSCAATCHGWKNGAWKRESYNASY